MLEVTGWIKYAEEDNWAEGCLPKTASSISGDDFFKAESQREMIAKLQYFVGTNDNDAVEYNACGDEGRVDISLMEDENGQQPNSQDMEDWKNGRIKLWSISYTFIIESVERQRFVLVEPEGQNDDTGNA